MTGSEALAAATRALTAAGIPDAGRDARRLLAHVLKVPAGRLTLYLPEPVPPDLGVIYNVLIERRCERVPVSHLTGRRLFYGRDFLVTPEVLDPRPETETLIEAALAAPFANVLDLGTGSGCIGAPPAASRPNVATSVPTCAVRRTALRIEAAGASSPASGSWCARADTRVRTASIVCPTGSDRIIRTIGSGSGRARASSVCRSPSSARVGSRRCQSR